eukprot:6184187-Pleurochrysis_carterae.AAC.1
MRGSTSLMSAPTACARRCTQAGDVQRDVVLRVCWLCGCRLDAMNDELLDDCTALPCETRYVLRSEPCVDKIERTHPRPHAQMFKSVSNAQL